MSEINFPDNLDELMITNTKIKTLNGIENIKSLVKLEISHNKNLTAIQELKRIEIGSLLIIACNKIKDLHSLKENQSIQYLYIDKLQSLEEIGPIISVRTIGFQDLKDGRTDLALEWPELKEITFYPNKKHCSHTEKQLNQILSGKSN
ncbi:leucine-rich repeat domain-containing protein [Chryseobacterium gregarium]|uniref:leucine-rich repeat domain-containing protein n=1 Tax=Chryseobacterium gregarium TaxID=456299 RepID=UPI0004045FE2|nr:leucine-rich repeat domain-containing protein [Chryseobacterium gregarium]